MKKTEGKSKITEELEAPCTVVSSDTVLVLHSCNCLDITYGFVSKSTKSAVLVPLELRLSCSEITLFIKSAKLCVVTVNRYR